MIKFLGTILLLFCLPCAAATIYKSVDEKGRVTFSDQMPVKNTLVDVLNYTATAPTLAADDAARLDQMRETTDRMAADRREREESRARIRKERAPQQLVLVQQESYYPLYGRRYRRPIVRPPMYRPPMHRPLSVGRSAIRSQYPAKLIRQHYTGAAARVFNPQGSSWVAR
jgi:hypothetical protein